MPKSKQQFAEIREQSRAKILAAALDLFAERGFHATPVSAIAKRAGVAAGLLYNYYRSKDDLLKQIVHEAQNEVRETVEVCLQGLTRRNLPGFLDALIPLLEQRKDRSRMLVSVMLQPDASRIAKGSSAGFDEPFYHAVKTLDLTTIERLGITTRELAEMIHAIVMVYLITGNDRMSRHLVKLLVGSN